VFIATQLGIVRSSDGGATWQYALAPNQAIGVSGSPTGNYYNDLATDLELGTDGILYAAFNPSRVFRSNDATGSAWTEITPSGITGERTELALAPSTSSSGQVIYGVSRKYNSTNYGQDITWFKKSTDGGTTWTNLTIPTSGSSYFTGGSGSSNLNLSVNPTDPNTVYAGGYGWFRSTNGGSVWTSLDQTAYQNQQGLFFQPGNVLSIAYATDNGIYWSANWGDNSVSNPTVNSRNSGYRVGEISSVSMKNVPGSSFLLAGSRPDGHVQLTTAGLSTGNIIWYANYPGLTFVDEDDPTLQIFQSYGSFYRYSSSSSTQLTSLTSYYTTAAAEYDSPSNTLYVADYLNNQGFLRKVTGVATTPQSVTVPLTGITSLASYLKLSPDQAKLHIGANSGKVYKISNLGQSAPTVTAIDNGALPQYTTVSCIDVGADENELLVTLSNFGVQSVWYTSNGGATWTGKDQSNFGLPDVPVRSALFNPQNRKQVLLGTDAGIWTTDDITAANPGWTYSGAGMGPLRVDQLRYRASDGRMTAATNGRGVWQSDALAIPYTPSTIAITGISNTTLCAGSTFTASYSATGAAATPNTTIEVWLSAANGSFINQKKIGSGTSSPISVTLPTGYNALPYGTNYQFKVVASAQGVESDPVGAVTIGNLGISSTYDRLNSTGSVICAGSQAILRITARDLNYNTTTADGYQWSFNGTPISGATSQTVVAQQEGSYQAMVRQAGCSITSGGYALYTSTNLSTYVRSPSNGEPQCDDHPLKLSSSYIGEPATYQWTRNAVDITGATSYTYTATQTGNYSVRVVDGSCASTAQASYFQFGRSLRSSVYLSSSQYDSLLCTSPSYQEIPLAADFPSSNDYTVQWYRNGTSIPSATFSYYYAYQPGAYSILLKQGSCETRSNAVVIGLTDQLKVSVDYAYNDKSACLGETRYLYSSISYGGSLQWQKNGINIPGATGNNYAATSSGDYSVRITRGTCSASSPPISLTFSNAIQPKVEFGYFTASEACTNATVRLADNYNLSGYQYQWYRDGVLVNGAVYTNYSASQSGIYSLKVTNGSCTGLSKGVYANVGNGKTSKPTIFPSSTTRQLCVNNSISLNASTYYGNLQWKRNGIPIPGETRYIYYATQSGLYSVVSQDGTCTAESDPIEVRIGEATTATLSGNALISNGQSTLLPVSFTGPAPWSASLTTGQSITATYQNPAFIAVSPTSNTTYQLASVVNACGTGTVSGQASVSVGTGSADVSANMTVSNRTPRVGELVAFTVLLSNAGPQESIGVRASCVLPPGLEFVDAPSIGLSYANGTVLADVGIIGVNGSIGFQFRARAIQTGVFITALQITGTQTPDPDSQPDSGTGDGQDDVATVDIRTADGTGPLLASANPNQVPLPGVSGNQPVPDANTADLSLGMQMDKLTPVVNELVTASFTVSNRGGSAAASVVVQVVLPNGTFSTQSPAGWILVSGQTYKRYINALPAGQSATVSLLWQPAGTGMVKAQILDADVADPDSTPGNGYDNGEDDTASITLRVR
jgi:uncharacterized repeat protein (TIGR01451 family)